MFKIDLKRSAEPVDAMAGAADDLRLLVRPFGPLIAVVVVLLAAFWVVNGRLDRSIEEEHARVEGLATSLAESKQRLANVSGKARVLYETARPEVYWSDELRLLSEKLPDKVWLTQVKVTSSQMTKTEKGEVMVPGGLVVDGGVLSNANEGNLDVIGKLIQDLQADPRFATSFSTIALESVQRSAEPHTLAFRLKIGLKS